MNEIASFSGVQIGLFRAATMGGTSPRGRRKSASTSQRIGGLAGFLLGYSGPLTRGLASTDRQEKRSPFVEMIAIVVVLGAVASVVAAIAHGRPRELRTAPSLVRRNVANTGVAVSVPASLSARPPAPTDDEVVTRTFEDINHDPIVVKVVVVPLSPGVKDDERAAYVEGLLANLPALAGANGAEVVDGARVETVDGRPFATLRQKTSQDVRLRAWVTAQDTREVIVVGLSRKEVSAPWTRIAERAVGSIRIEP